MSDEKRKRGRPPAPEPKTTLCVWVFSRQYDAINRAATRREMSVSSYVREMLVKAYPSLDRGTLPIRKKSA